jgi:malate/lactate dehydrogenase
MIKVSIIGSGNVAQHLINRFKEIQNSSSKLELVQVYSRRELNPSTRPKPNCN